MAAPPPTQEQLDRAARYVRKGRYEEAIQAYAAAVAGDAALPDAWFNLAWLQRVTRRFDDALLSYEKALAQGIAAPEEAHLNRATILSEHLQQTEAAEAELISALRINPAFLPARLNLGNLYEDMGRVEDAIDAYEQVLRIDDGNGRAHARLGIIAAQTGDPAAAATRLKQALPAARSIQDRAEMLFALGSALDAAASYDDAFHAFEAANWLAQSVSRVRYNPVEQERVVDQMIRLLHEPLRSGVGSGGTAPLFICGMFRSGSTLAEQIIGRHPAVTVGGELDFIPALVHAHLQPYPQALTRLDSHAAANLRADYLGQLDRAGLAGTLVTDKRCDNFLHIGLIKALFPQSRIVNTVRQPLDNLLSIYFLHFGEGVSYGHDLREAAHFYLQYRRLMHHWRQLFPDDIHDMNYDETVADPRSAVAPMLTFAGLPWDEACLGTQGSTPVRTASAWQVRQPLHRRSSGRWRHYATHLQPVRQMLAASGLEEEIG